MTPKAEARGMERRTKKVTRRILRACILCTASSSSMHLPPRNLHAPPSPLCSWLRAHSSMPPPPSGTEYLCGAYYSFAPPQCCAIPPGYRDGFKAAGSSYAVHGPGTWSWRGRSAVTQWSQRHSRCCSSSPAAVYSSTAAETTLQCIQQRPAGYRCRLRTSLHHRSYGTSCC